MTKEQVLDTRDPTPEELAEHWLARHGWTRETFAAAVVDDLARGRSLVAWPMLDEDGRDMMFQPWWQDTCDFMPSLLVTELYRRGLIGWRDETPTGWADVQHLPVAQPAP